MKYGSNSETEYSRLKVPAHQKCNSENGSRFENYVLSLLDEMHLNLDVMRELHVPAHSKAAAQVKVAQHAEADPTAYLVAVGHVWAVRENLPVKPNLEFSEERIIDRSRNGYALAPGIDADTVNRRALDFRNDLVHVRCECS